MINKPDALIFDMDGTLWDALDSYVWIWNEGFRQLNINRTFTREDLIGLMGKQPDEIIEKCIEGNEKANVTKVYEKVFGLQEKTMLLLGGKLYEGVREGIAALSEKYKLMLLSNCERYGINQFLEYTQLTPYFTDTLTFGETRLPKALNMQLLKARHQLKDPVYIGDTDSDRIQTEAAGLPFIFVEYGFGHTDKYDLKFNHFKDLTSYFLALD
ncbi:MAG: HAD family hydrolase [Bacteroidales bacterium]